MLATVRELVGELVAVTTLAAGESLRPRVVLARRPVKRQYLLTLREPFLRIQSGYASQAANSPCALPGLLVLSDPCLKLVLAFGDVLAVALQARRASLEAGAPLYLGCLLDASVCQRVSLGDRLLVIDGDLSG
jgi:hypothetical protein